MGGSEGEAAALINYSATFGVPFLLSLYLQLVQGLTVQTAGTILVVQPVVQDLVSPLAGWLSERVEPRIIASAGMGMIAVGLFVLTTIAETTRLSLLLPLLALLGVSFALFSSPNTNAVMGQVLTSGPDSQWAAIRQLYFFMIGSAQTHVYIQSPFFIPDRTIDEALKAAALAGVDVRVMLSARPSGNRLPQWAGNTYVADIAASGVRVFLYEEGYLHAKTISVDGRACSIGSANIDIRSFSINYEINAIPTASASPGSWRRTSPATSPSAPSSTHPPIRSARRPPGSGTRSRDSCRRSCRAPDAALRAAAPEESLPLGAARRRAGRRRRRRRLGLQVVHHVDDPVDVARDLLRAGFLFGRRHGTDQIDRAAVDVDVHRGQRSGNLGGDSPLGLVEEPLVVEVLPGGSASDGLAPG